MDSRARGRQTRGMKQDDRPDVVDLRSYKQARARSQAQAAKARPAASGKEPLLGSRRNAGLLLALVILVLLAVTLGPGLL